MLVAKDGTPMQPGIVKSVELISTYFINIY